MLDPGVDFFSMIYLKRKKHFAFIFPRNSSSCTGHYVVRLRPDQVLSSARFRDLR